MSAIRACGCTRFTDATTRSMFDRAESGSRPRSASLAPVSMTTRSAGLRSTHSIRRTAPAVVSPLSPALTALIGVPAESASLETSAGYACSGSRPGPAVRLVPKNTTVGRRDPCAAFETGLFSESFCSLLRCAASIFRSGAHAATSAYIRNSRRNRRVTLMLIAKDITKEYQSGDRKLAVLRNVSFSIPQGSFIAIVGPSGSGKTTLLGLLAGLDTPTRGSVTVEDVDLAALDENARARLRGEKVGFVFQTFQLIPTLTALENVQVPLELRGSPGAAERASELLDRVGL